VYLRQELKAKITAVLVPQCISFKLVIQLHEFIIVVGFVVFGHHDLLILCHLTPFCWDFIKKESTAITQEA
jgi:hypothetical protein